MATVRPTRRIERAGINPLRTLLEDHDHLVQEIEGGIDHGEDLLVFLTMEGRRTGHAVAIQVKSGRSYRRANGYAIPLDNHLEDWRDNRIPVVGVVYDADAKQLYWVNLSKYLKDLRPSKKMPSWIPVPLENLLSAASLDDFIAEIKSHIDSPAIDAYHFLQEALGTWHYSIQGIMAHNVTMNLEHPRENLEMECNVRYEMANAALMRFANCVDAATAREARRVFEAVKHWADLVIDGLLPSTHPGADHEAEERIEWAEERLHARLCDELRLKAEDDVLPVTYENITMAAPMKLGGTGLRF